MRDNAAALDYYQPASLTRAELAKIEERINAATSKADGYDPVADVKRTLGAAPPWRRRRYKAMGWVLSLGFMPWCGPCLAHHVPAGQRYSTCIMAAGPRVPLL